MRKELERGSAAFTIVWAGLAAAAILFALQTGFVVSDGKPFYYEAGLLSELSGVESLYKNELGGSLKPPPLSRAFIEGAETGRAIKEFTKNNGTSKLGGVVWAVNERKKSLSKEELFAFDARLQRQNMHQLVLFLSEANEWEHFAKYEQNISTLTAIIQGKAWNQSSEPENLFSGGQIFLLVQFISFLILFIRTRGNPWAVIPDDAYRGRDQMSYFFIACTIPASLPLIAMSGIFWFYEERAAEKPPVPSHRSSNSELDEAFANSKQLLDNLRSKLDSGGR